jgi:signal transduction histidine kinase
VGRHRRDEVVVSVSDYCGGIAEHDLERVFDLAYTSDPARSMAKTAAEPNGTAIASGGGLGLAIAKGFVEAHVSSVVLDRFGVAGLHGFPRLVRGEASQVPQREALSA